MPLGYPTVLIHAQKAKSIARKHPWVFSGAIKSTKEYEALEEGTLVYLSTDGKSIIATAYKAKGRIAFKILAFEETIIDQNFWQKRIQRAIESRKTIGLVDNTHTTAYRLINGEGDRLPGLIVDVYNSTAVVQAHSKAILNQLDQISAVLKNSLGIERVFNKSAAILARKQIYSAPSDPKVDGLLIGTETKVELVKENNYSFEVDYITGQKTGFFLDQRENRALIQQYAKNKKVLNTFCYSGGFSVYALGAGATQVDSVDSSSAAIELTEKNVKHNFESDKTHRGYVMDSLHFMKEKPNNYDLIILDPPAYAKGIKSKHKAVQAYKRLNIQALKIIQEGGILFTFSCSQVIDRKLFTDTIRAAAIHSARSIQILHQLSQGPDHPINLFVSESEYLKGLVLRVD